MFNLNVLMVNFEFPPIGGGTGVAHLSLLKEYTHYSNLRVGVLTSASKPGFFKEEFSDNITLYKVGLHKKHLYLWLRREVMEWFIKSYFHYRKLLRENDYDLVHAFSAVPSAFLCYLTAHKLPYLISLRGPSDVPGMDRRLEFDYKILGPLFFKLVWKKASAIVACSDGLKDRALDFCSSVSIGVIPNAVEPGRFYSANTSGGSDKLRLLYAGRFSLVKRVELLIDAVEILHKQGFKFSFTIAGDGPLKSKLRKTISERNINNVVKMPGVFKWEEMPQVYRAHDIFLSASEGEGMSNAMLEAMASGLPIITTSCEGVKELIGDNGVVLSQPDPHLIAIAIRSLGTNKDTLKNMGIAARKRAENFTHQNIAQDYLAYYEKIKRERKQ